MTDLALNKTDRLFSQDLPTGILSQRSVVVVYHPCIGTEDNILEDRTKSNCIENIWFLLNREIDALRVALGLDLAQKDG